MPDLEEVTTSEVTEPSVPDNESAGDSTETPETSESNEPDGIAMRDAKIAELQAEILTLQADNQALRAHNYDLIMSAAPSPEQVSSEPVEDTGTGGVDELFTDRG
jgi:hypothetical protein